MLQKANLARLQEYQTFALALSTSCSPSHTMNVVSWVIWRIDLQDPVNCRDIETSSGDVCADESALLCIAEFEECVCTLLLLLLAVEGKHGQVDIIEEIGVVIDGGAG